MTNTTQSMFESIKSSLKNRRNNSFKDVLKTEIDKTYLIRMIPNKNVDPIQTFYHYYHHTWESKATGQTVGSLCLSTIDERCPMCEQRFKLYNSKDPNKKELAKLLNRKENWLVNCFVIQDPTRPENEKTVKIFRFGKQVKDLVSQALDGLDAKDVGPDAMFDLNDKGCSFRIVVKKNEGGYATYVFSKFLNKSVIEGMTPEKIKDILEKQTHDLSQIYKQLPKKEMLEMIDEHVFCKGENDPFAMNESSGTVVKMNDVPKERNVEEPVAPDNSNNNIDKLLEGLDG